MSAGALPPSFTLEEQQKQKEYEWIRDQIVHEDNLINHRLTWLIVVQGFLFVAFGTIHTAIFANKPPFAYVICLELILMLVYTTAIWLCSIVGKGVLCASNQWGVLVQWWYKKYPAEAFTPHTDESSGRSWVYGVLRWFARPVVWTVERLCPWAIGWKLQTQSAWSIQCLETNYPPITGFFTISPRWSLKMIPALFLFLNFTLLLACPTIATCYYVFGVQSQSIKIDYEKKEGTSTIKVTLESPNHHEAETLAKKLLDKLP